MKDLRFDLFRYQILPRDRFQTKLFTEKPLDEIIEHKNEFFADILRKKEDFGLDRVHVISKCLFDEDSFLLFRLAVNRSLRRETKDFNEELMDTWPKFYVAIWNDPEKQIMAVEERKDAFQQTRAVVNIIDEAVNSMLAQYGLRAYFKPLFVKEDFWQIVENYKGKIKEIEFELITPNMANIAGTVSEELKELARSTNTSRTKIGVAADQDAALNISKNDIQVNSLVEYASEGGGSIAVKVSNLKKKLRTCDSTKTIEISDISISGAQPDEIAALIKDFMT
jgi:hypothetical protein